jgi:hypothetical protein
MRTVLLVQATVAGLFGGLIAPYMTTVRAQEPGVEILHSKDFVLLDGAGHKRGEWKMDSSGQPVLRLFDSQGRVIWDTTGTPRAQLTPAQR